MTVYFASQLVAMRVANFSKENYGKISTFKQHSPQFYYPILSSAAIFWTTHTYRVKWPAVAILKYTSSTHVNNDRLILLQQD